MYIYGVVLTECGGDDGLLDSAIHHQPRAQAQQQRGKYHNNSNGWFAHDSDNSSLDKCRHRTDMGKCCNKVGKAPALNAPRFASH
jgi:hypothetical protein